MAKRKLQDYATRVTAADKIRLAKIDASFVAGLDKPGGKEMLAAMGDELNRLQELLYAASTHSLLVVLQGMDTAGKDGAIRHVMKYFDPQGCRVEGFKAPTGEELAHDFLWRVHKVAPARGQATIFNRSHYEDVIAVRVQNLAPRAVWQKRYDRINEFEELLYENNTIVLKFFLHISKEKQEERLLAREAEPEKAWKLSVGDWEQRALWNDYQRAYEDAIARCSTPHAPWFIVPADHKWFRDVAIAQVLIETLRRYEKGWKQVLASRSLARTEKLKEFREQSMVTKNASGSKN